MDQRGHDAGPGHAEWMAKRDRPAVRVEAIHVPAQLARDRQHLRGEGLVELEDIDVLDSHAGGRQYLAHRVDRTDTHDRGVDAANRRRVDPCAWHDTLL